MENGGCSNWIVSIGQCLIYWVLPAECGREVPKLPACKISTIAADRGSASIHSLLLAGAVWGVWNVIFWTVFRKRWSTDRWVAADRLKFRFNSVFNSVLCCFALVLCIGCCVGPYKRYVRTVWNDDDCQNTNYGTQHEVVLWHSYNILFIWLLKFLFLSFDMRKKYNFNEFL